MNEENVANKPDAGAVSRVDDDILSREVTVNASLDASGVTLKAKSRLVAAIDRLAGSLFDWPASVLEGRAAKRRLKDQIERDLLATQGRAAAKQLEDAYATQPILLEAQKEDVRRQVNKLGVAIEAMEAIKALPPPGASQFSGDGSASQPSGSPDEAPSVNEDWMNSFVRFSEDASSEDLQALWGRVLAGEVRQPGTFSKRTLRFVSELDQQTAQDCEAFAQHVLQDFALKNDAWSSGEGMALLLRLEELGLISGAGGFLSKTMTLDENGRAGIFARRFGLILHGTAGAQKNIPVVIVTRLGSEVFSLLLPADEEGALREVANAIDKGDLHRMDVGEVRLLGGGRATLENARIVWSTGQALTLPAASSGAS